MANRFTIIIDAVDKATAVVRGVKRAVSTVVKPITDVRASVVRLGKELGIDKVGKSLGKVAAISKVVAGKFFSIGTALTGFAGLASVTAIAAFARNWTQAAQSIDRFSQITGIGVVDVQKIGGAAQILGLDAAEARSSLKAFGDTLEDVTAGRNLEALMLLRRRGLRMAFKSDGSIDVMRTLERVADSIREIKNPQAQIKMAQVLGLEPMLPLLKRGSAGLHELEKAAKDAGYVMDEGGLKKSSVLAEDLTKLKQSAEGVANSLMIKLTPALDSAATATAGFLNKHREGISGGIFDYLKFIAGAPSLWGHLHWGGATPSSTRAAPAKNVLELVRKLENSADNAVSKPAFAGSHGGAVGRYQILPSTAKLYGFDPDRLKDPAYNEMVAKAILGDLTKRYGSDVDSILVGYNSTIKRANLFHKYHDLRSLLPETQAYLSHAHRIGLQRQEEQRRQVPGPMDHRIALDVNFNHAPQGTRAIVKGKNVLPVKVKMSMLSEAD